MSEVWNEDIFLPNYLSNLNLKRLINSIDYSYRYCWFNSLVSNKENEKTSAANYKLLNLNKFCGCDFLKLKTK